MEDKSDSIEAELIEAKRLVESLKIEKKNDEAIFGHKRAQFMEMYNKKELELQSAHSDIEQLQSELSKLRTELSDVSTAAAISESNRQDEVESLRRQFTEEMASLQHIMNG